LILPHFLIDINNNVWAVGYNGVGQLGDGSTANKLNFAKVNGDLKAISIVSSYYSTYLLDKDHKVSTTGSGSYYQLGNDSTANKSSFSYCTNSLFTQNKFIKIAAGSNYSVFLIESNHRLYGLGYNAQGQLGTGDTTQKTSPTILNTTTDIIDVVCGYAHTVALDINHDVWVTGNNSSGQLGIGTYVNSNVLTKVLTIPKIEKIFCSNNSTFLIDVDGYIWATGYNSGYILGDGTSTNKNSFVRINIQ
jgi:alpha-tubulin suppressor-like RCC1 family protein